jgi:hypothetical protein
VKLADAYQLTAAETLQRPGSTPLPKALQLHQTRKATIGIELKPRLTKISGAPPHCNFLPNRP